MAEILVEAHNLVKIYKSADIEVVALQGLDLRVPRGEMLALVGPSGAGKSTLLNILGGLDTPSAGQCEVAGVDLTHLSAKERLLYRRRIVGHVWQQTSRNLLSDLSLLDNVMVPMVLAGSSAGKRKQRARELLELVGLGPRMHHKPERLSGGEQQRGALAVALANNPVLLLGDEPTGELDSVTAREVLSLLRRLNAELGLTTILVTHDQLVAEAMDRSVAIRDGRTSTEVVHAEEAEETVIIDRVGRFRSRRRCWRRSRSGAERGCISPGTTWNCGLLGLCRRHWGETMVRGLGPPTCGDLNRFMGGSILCGMACEDWVAVSADLADFRGCGGSVVAGG